MSKRAVFKSVGSHKEAENRWSGGRVCGGRGMATGPAIHEACDKFVRYDLAGGKLHLLISSRAHALAIAKLSSGRTLRGE